MKRSNNSVLKNQFVKKHKLETLLPSKALDELILFELPAGKQIFTQGQRFHYIYFLVQGKVLIDQIDANGKQAVFAFESKASLIGEIELFHGELGISYCNAFTVEPTLLLGMSIETVKTYGLNDARFLRFVCSQLSEKLYRSNIFQPRAGNTACEKLKRYLRSRIHSDGMQFRLENREDIASLLGISIRQLNRVIKQFSLEKVIAVKAKNLVVLAPEKLTPSS